MSTKHRVYSIVINDMRDPHEYLIAASDMWAAMDTITQQMDVFGNFYGHTRQDTISVQGDALLRGTWPAYTVIDSGNGLPFQDSYSNIVD